MAENIWLWSLTASDNDDADPAVPWPENMLPGAVNNAARSTMACIARAFADINGSLTTTGSANAYAATCNSGVTAFTNNQLVTVQASFTNTGASTFNLNSLGAKAIKYFSAAGESSIGAGQIQNGGRYQLSYSTAAAGGSGAWILLNPAHLERVGNISLWGSDTAPTGTLFCNGQAVSRTTYADLFTAIGTTYGTGDNSTTFNVPDFRGRAPFGSDDMGTSAASRVTTAGSGVDGATLGASGGAETVTLTSSTIPSHTHTGTTAAGGTHTHGGTTDGGGVDHTHTGTTDSGGSHSHTVSGGVYGGNNNAVQFGAQSGVFAPTGPTLVAIDSGGAHTHTFTTNTASAVSHTHTFTTGSGGSHTHTFTSDATGSGNAHNNMPPALICNFIIRY